MKDWVRFVLRHKRLLNFGFLFNFFSSFGQTFFISLFVPFWVESLQISNAVFGSMYATVTVISAFLISLVGRYIDHVPLKRYGLIVFTGLMISLVILSQAYNYLSLMLGLFLVRWFGQGLMTHTSSTGIAKLFDRNLGKALGFTALGHPAGQFVLPLIAAPLIAVNGWRMSLLFLGLASVLFIIPSLWAISPVAEYKPDLPDKNGKQASSGNYFRSFTFWVIAANAFIIPFICTAVFLYQYSIGQSRGWDASWVTFSFTFFAVFTALALFLSGNLIDRYSGRTLFPLYLLPALLALFSIPIVDSKWIFPAFYGLLGISSGLGSTIKTAIQTEIYGTANLGKIRSYFSTLLVISTALGPPVFGYFLDKQISFDRVLAISGMVVLIIALLSFRLWRDQCRDVNTL